MRHRVFISHCEEDHSTALDICRRIELRGVKCWIAPRDVVVGEDYLTRIGQAITRSGAFVVVLSDRTNRSRFVKAEAEYAFNDDLTIFPVRIENIEIEEGLRVLVSIHHRIDAFGANRAARLEELAGAVVRSVLSGKPGGGGGGSGKGLLDKGSVLRKAIGPGAMEFMAQWRAMDVRGSRIAWSWEAVLGGPLWPFYRGMVLAGIGCALLLALMIIIGAAQGEQGALAGFLTGWLILAILVALTGSAALRRHVGNALRHDRPPSPALLRVAGLAAGVAAIAAAFALTLPQDQRPTPTPTPFPSGQGTAVPSPPVVTPPRPPFPDPVIVGEVVPEAPDNGLVDVIRNIMVKQQDEAAAAAATANSVMESDTMAPAGNMM